MSDTRNVPVTTAISNEALAKGLDEYLSGQKVLRVGLNCDGRIVIEFEGYLCLLLDGSKFQVTCLGTH
jgi:hypothetical protein